ncbi:hypothetical protein SERLA73DRAFT_160705 [Serpula lacrymans var. lacrymans S7.3]|uniref:Nephrocystin 3-like N-terminal domain-containing protein n=1 Tax=Serpula lacrymans var. lacrymans (strain S7.3) TaxID=936435 RepID=F8PWR2_SERL3|nr:hypothetical protein SERLA73DRAFT_160705 [Serpula lacrymans var. lacrymans S7.3]
MSHDVDVQGTMAQASSVDARHSTFSEVHGQQVNVNGDHTTINTYSRDNVEERKKLAAWLTPLNFRRTQSDVYGSKQEGTGDWVLDDEKFKEWIRCDTKFKTLWCPGIPGAGKTVLAQVSHIINFLTEKHKDTDVAVAFIYCNYKEQPKVDDLVASLLKQLVECSSTTFKNVATRYEFHQQTDSRPTPEDVHKTLVSEIKHFSQVFVVTDALDEITETGANRYKLLKRLQSLECHLLVTSRDIKSIGDALRDFPCMRLRANEKDIRQYIEGCFLLEQTLAGLIVEDPPLKEEIVEGVTKYADGMFLLCRLHVGSLENMVTCKEVRDALKNLSQGLNSAYDGTMSRIHKLNEKRRELALTAIMCITYAHEPLSGRALQEAVTLSRGSTGIDSDNLVGIDTILGACIGLVKVDKERSVARLIHYTAQDYFSEYKEWLCSNPHSELTNICLKALLLSLPADGSDGNDDGDDYDYVVLLKR